MPKSRAVLLVLVSLIAIAAIAPGQASADGEDPPPGGAPPDLLPGLGDLDPWGGRPCRPTCE